MGVTNKGTKAKYAQIADDIRYKIQSKVFVEDKKLPTESELAEQYDVSRITSQKALDVLENEGLIYRVRGSGSFVAKQSNLTNTKNMTNMIAILLPFDSLQGGGMDILSGAEAVSKANEYYVSLHNSQRSLMTEREMILKLLNDGVKGIIYYPLHTSENFDLLCMLTADKYPIVMIDKYTQDIPIDSVVSDNYDGGYKITEYLIKNGHKNIVFVSGEPIDQLSSIKERFLGYFNALQDNKMHLDIDNVIYDLTGLANEWGLGGIHDIDFNCKLLKHILNEKKDITSIQAASDSIATELLRAGQFMGLEIPGQLSIVGFDNLDITTIVSPNITTVNQDLYQIGAKGAELVIGRIKNPNKVHEKIELPVELIIRESVFNRNTP